MGWGGRFDDPQERFRTLYCAEERITCFRETLQDLRPNTRALAEFLELKGERSLIGLLPAGVVEIAWRRRHVLVPLEVRPGAAVTDLDDPAVRRSLERELAPELRDARIEHLDTSQLTSKNRSLTRRLARILYDRGEAGVLYRSNLDSQPCLALFQGRVTVVRGGRSQPLTRAIPELLKVCSEFDLVLRHPSE
jgi:hypothetical protein